MAKSKSKPSHASAQTAVVRARPSASLLKQASKFLNTTAGLDLTLRLFHGIVIITAKSSDELIAARSFIAASQLDLGKPTTFQLLGMKIEKRQWPNLIKSSEAISAFLCPPRLHPKCIRNGPQRLRLNSVQDAGHGGMELSAHVFPLGKSHHGISPLPPLSPCPKVMGIFMIIRLTALIESYTS